MNKPEGFAGLPEHLQPSNLPSPQMSELAQCTVSISHPAHDWCKGIPFQQVKSAAMSELTIHTYPWETTKAQVLLDELAALRASRDAERERAEKAERNEKRLRQLKDDMDMDTGITDPMMAWRDEKNKVADLTAKLEAMEKEANHHMRQRAYEVEASSKLRQQLAASEQEVQRLGVFHEDDEPSWRHHAEKLKQQLAASELAAYDMNCTIAALKQQLADAQATIDAQCREAASLNQCITNLEENVKRLEGILSGEAIVMAIHYEPGQPLDLRMSHPLVAALAASLADLLDQTKAENYTQASMWHGEKAFTMTIQREGKPTAHELRRKAETERDQLQATVTAQQEEITRLRKVMEDVGGMPGMYWLEGQLALAQALAAKEVL